MIGQDKNDFIVTVRGSHTVYKSSAVAEMGDRGHSRHGPKRGGAAVPLSMGGWVSV